MQVQVLSQHFCTTTHPCSEPVIFNTRSVQQSTLPNLGGRQGWRLCVVWENVPEKRVTLT